MTGGESSAPWKTYPMFVGSALDTWATVAVAIGTIGAVAYALFRDLVVTPRRRPKLELRFDGSAANDQVIVKSASGVATACVRLRVANGAGKDTADDVVVMVTGLARLDDESDETVVRPVSLPLVWSGSSPQFTVASVHPGSERHIDLLHLDLPAADEDDVVRTWSATVSCQLDVSPKSVGVEDALEPGRYEVSVEVRARNADAGRYAIPVSWDGGWSGQEGVWDHLRVERPRRVR